MQERFMTSWDLYSGILAVGRRGYHYANGFMLVPWCVSWTVWKTFRVSRQNYLLYVHYATLDLDKLGWGKLTSCPMKFNLSKIFLATSFIEAPQLGLVAKKQGFPKLCPSLANLRDRARSSAYKEAKKMWSHICDYSTIPVNIVLVLENARTGRSELLASFWEFVWLCEYGSFRTIYEGIGI